MKVTVIGSTGHVGTYLVPGLVQAGHEVTAVSRGKRKPYHDSSEWKAVRMVEAERIEGVNDRAFSETIAGIGSDVVIDMICFTRSAAEAMAESLYERVGHYLVCGTIWIYGPSSLVPAAEDQPRRPFGDYGTAKLAMTEYLEKRAAVDALPVTLIHPGHIVGPGWVPLNPQGNFNPNVFRTIAEGRELTIPNFGMETVHHVHAEDVARLFLSALSSRSQSIGESFHAVSPAAVTLRGYAEAAYHWFGNDPKLRFMPYDEWAKTVSEADAKSTWEHIVHSPNCSMLKAERLLGYRPRYGSLEAVREAVEWLQRRGFEPQ